MRIVTNEISLPSDTKRPTDERADEIHDAS